MQLSLVSVIVISYNSSKFILQTLESCKSQSYENIELIIADDGSKDETVKICEKWLEVNHQSFTNTKLITVQENTGISANCNRGVKAAQGQWIKLIAGDDILLQNCIKDYVEFTYHKSDAVLCVSKIKVFNDNGYDEQMADRYNQITRNFTSKTANSQAKSYLRYPVMLNIPSEFIRADIIKKLEGFDEEFKLLEDTPFLSKFFIKGYKLDFMNTYTVKYRRHGSNLTTTNSIAFETNLYNCYVKYARPHLKFFNLLDLLFLIYRDYYFKLKLKNKSSFIAVNYYKISYILSRFA